MFTSRFYILAPVWVQNLLLTLRGFARKLVRENKLSEGLCRELQQLEYDSTLLSDFHNKALGATLASALINVNFYRSLNKANADKLTSFPYISKNDLRENSTIFENDHKPKFLVKGGTSGTTGAAVIIPQPFKAVIREQAFIRRSLIWAGYKKGDKRAWIRGDRIVPPEQLKPPYWRYSHFDDMILLSSLHMTKGALPLYIEAMVDYGVDVIQAYPSSITILAKYLEAQDAYYPSALKSILTSSESLSAEDKALIEKRFRCRVFDWYGLFERVAAIASCEEGRYHVMTDYGHVEFLDCGDGRHEIVGTSFNNIFYPLIRYKTGDYVQLSDEKSCPCGRVYPLVKSIEGRATDYLYGCNGSKAFCMDQVVKGVSGILGSQFFQNSYEEVDAFIIPSASFTKDEEAKLISKIRSRLGSGMIVNLSRVDELTRTSNGKVRQIICTVPEQEEVSSYPEQEEIVS